MHAAAKHERGAAEQQQDSSDERPHQPTERDAPRVVPGEAGPVAQDLGALGRVHDLRMELDAEAVVAVRDHGVGCVSGVPDGREAGRRFGDAVAVAHPDR